MNWGNPHLLYLLWLIPLYWLLARHLDRKYRLGARLSTERRIERRVPHLGRVELTTRFTDKFAEPLPSPLEPEEV